MSFQNTHNVRWRFQGLWSSCWLTSIEMLMQSKYGSVYGEGQTQHSEAAMAAFKKNRGARIEAHAQHYGLARNENLRDETDLLPWETALRHGPVIAEGYYGARRLGIGSHVIVIAGISVTGQLAYFNPNLFAVLPHPKEKVSYMSIERCIKLSHRGTGFSAFWQTSADVNQQ